MKTAQQYYDQEFPNCARSKEWKEGALRGCQLEAGEVTPRRSGHPYQHDDAKFDAYCWGIECGRRSWRYAAELGELQRDDDAAVDRMEAALASEGAL